MAKKTLRQEIDDLQNDLAIEKRLTHSLRARVDQQETQRERDQDAMEHREIDVTYMTQQFEGRSKETEEANQELVNDNRTLLHVLRLSIRARE